MSWLQRLSETYDACFGQPQFAATSLTPIGHVEQQAHIEIALDEKGSFLRASVVPKESTLIPVTEKSAGRTSGAVAHPLCDKLRYVAADYGSADHSLYVEQLRRWTEYAHHQKLDAVLWYAEHGTAVQDLLQAGVLVTRPDGSLEETWNDGLSPLAKLLTPDPKTKKRNQGDALVRWRVEIPEEKETAVWKDARLQKEWAAYNATLPSVDGLCFVSGEIEPLAFSHPKRLRHGGDGAKLISTNDASGFTFRGRFSAAAEAYGLSSTTTQKAHNTLRWLIARQGARNGTQVIVAWDVRTASALPVMVDSWQLFDALAEEAQEKCPSALPAYESDAGQHFALRLKNAIRGYKERLDDNDDIVVMALDSATTGRMAILYYRELKASEFLTRLESWHSQFAWPQNFGKERRFVGVPAPRDIAEAAYGRRVDDKLRAATVERLLPSIVDGRPVPRDLVLAAVAHAVNRVALEHWEFERLLGIACSLFRGSHQKEDYTMSLDESRTTRDYLYGRLLAIADNTEELALLVAKENRDTNAARLMQRFADHPFSTWRTLELQLRPYTARLRGSRYAGALVIRHRLLDKVIDSFVTGADGQSNFLDNRPLSGEFLLGFHSQRELLRSRKTDSTMHFDAADEPEGDNE